MFSQPQESEEVEPEEPQEDETKIPMSDTAEDYYYDQYDGTSFAFVRSLCFDHLSNLEVLFRDPSNNITLGPKRFNMENHLFRLTIG